MSYRLHPVHGVLRIDTDEHITDRSHAGWPAYQQWLRDGNVPAPAEPEPAPLDALHARVRSHINIERNRRELGGFEYQGRTIDSDVASVLRIASGASTATAAAMFEQPWSVEWTCADDSTLMLDANGMIAMLAALAEYADAVHQHARALKAAAHALHLAGDRAGLEEFDVTAGWP